MSSKAQTSPEVLRTQLGSFSHDFAMTDGDASIISGSFYGLWVTGL